MIAYLKGEVIQKAPSNVIIDVGGVGFNVEMPQTSISAIPAVGEVALIHIYMNMTDKGISLYGFENTDEKEIFELLIGVSGVGPKIALSVLTYYSASEIVSLITAQDVKRLTNVPGLGKKMASRIVLELKDKLSAVTNDLDIVDEQNTGSISNIKEVVDALSSLGFTQLEIDLALDGVDKSLSVEEMIKLSLKKLNTK